jgi:response regulator RpfG family c-di-GMP phosphodiesterase
MQKYCRTLAEAAALAPAFAGQIDCRFVEQIEYCAAIHDLGRAALPDHILLKTSPPTPEERHTLESHTVIASELFRKLGRAAAGGQAFLQMAAAVTRYHHERYDGTGYPDRLGGDAIPLAARLVAVADAYDTLRCRRANKPGQPHSAAVQSLNLNSPGQFDPRVLEVFLQVADSFEATFREVPD